MRVESREAGAAGVAETVPQVATEVATAAVGCASRARENPVEAAGIEPGPERCGSGSWRTRMPIAREALAAPVTAIRCSGAQLELVGAVVLIAAAIAVGVGILP